MNKLFTKIATFVAGTALAVGVGVAVGSKDVREARADNPVDVLDSTVSGISGTSYTAFASKSKTTNPNKIYSDATYIGVCAGSNSSIQLRSDVTSSKPASGVVSTISGGKVRSVTISFESHTSAGRTVDVFASNTAYTEVADLVDNSKKGTLVGTIVNGTSTKVTITDDYSYIGFRSNSGAMYLSSVSIEWQVGNEKYVTYDPGTGTGTMTPTLIEDGKATISDCAFSNPGKYFTGWKDSLDNVYEVGSEYSFSDSTTLVAQWADATATGMTIKTAPTKVSYAVDDTFDPSGLVVNVTYDHDAASKDVAYAPDSGFTFSPDLETKLGLSDTKVTVTYAGFSQDQAITVAIAQKYKLITTDSGLVAGAKYIIGDGNGHFISSTQGSNNRPAATATIQDNQVPDADELEQFVLEEATGRWALKATRSAGYLYADGSGKNYLKTRQELQNTNDIWTITVNSSVVSINNVQNESNGQMRYNPNNGSPLFSCYSSSSTTGSASLKMYKLDETYPAYIVGPNTVDTTVEYQASVEDKDGNPVTGVKYTFTASDGATISESDEDAGTFTASTAGTVTISATKDGYVITDKVVTVTVFREISGIAVKTNPTKTSYKTNDPFDATGLVITVSYTSGDPLQEDVPYVGNEDQFSFEPAVVTSNGNVVVTYKGFTANVAVTVATITNVTGVAAHPDKVRLNTSINANEVTLNVVYSNEEVGVVTASSVECDTTTLGVKTATATYDGASGNKTATFEITVHNDGDGSLEYPYSVTEALAIINQHAGSSWNDDKSVYVKGIVVAGTTYVKGVETPTPLDTSYGCTFNITDGTNTIMAYSITGATCGTPTESKPTYVNVYYDVVVQGVLINYHNNTSGTDTPEVGFKNNDYPVSLASSVAPTLVSVTATVSEQTRYAGNPLSASDFTVTANFSNTKPAETISSGFAWTVNGVANGQLAIGNNTVVVSYADKSSEPINVTAVENTYEYVIDSSTVDKVYYVGEELDNTGLAVSKHYLSGLIETIDPSRVTTSGFDSSAAVASQTITVEVDGEPVGSFTVEIKEDVVSYSVNSSNVKTVYFIGDTLDTTGLVVTKNYESGKPSEDVTSQAVVEGFNSSVVNPALVLTVKVNEVTAGTYTISVSEVPTEPIKTQLRIKTAATKLTYKLNDTFSSEGLVVEALMSQGDPVTLTPSVDYTVTPEENWNTTAGEKTVTIHYLGTDASLADITYKVTVVAKEVASITTGGKYPVEFTVGDTFSYEGLIVTAHYTSELYEDEEVTGFEVTAPDMTTAGQDKVVTVSYGGKTTTYTVDVVAAPVTLESIEVTTNPTKTTYNVGEDFSPNGIVITAHYSDSSTKVINDSSEEFVSVTFSGTDFSTAGTKTITVTYGGKTTTFTVTVVEPTPTEKTLTSIAVTTAPSTTEFTVGDNFSANGIAITVTYSDSSTKVITDSSEEFSAVTFSGYDLSKAGEQTVTVTYSEGGVEKTATYTITVKAKQDPAKKGCFGDIASASIILSTLALAGTGLLVFKKRKEDK